MKLLIAIAILVISLNQAKAQLLPKCIMQKIAVGYDNSKIRIVTYKADTCYILEPIPDASQMTRHGIFMYNRNRMPDQKHPGLYNKECRPLFVENRNLRITSLEYNCKDIKVPIKK